MLGRRVIKKKLHTNRNFRRIFILIFSGIVFAVLVFSSFVYSFFMRGSVISPIQPEGSVKGTKTYQDSIYRKTLLSLKEENIPFIDVKVASDSSIIIRLSEKNEAILSTEKDILEQISSLQVILTRLTMEGREYARLDLRFDKPLISL